MTRRYQTPLAYASAAAVLLVASIGLLAPPVAAHPTPEPRCAGETYAVVAAEGDAAMAELVASWHVLDTRCVVEPGDTGRIGSHEVVVLGGTAAVPESVLRGLNVIVRLAGADRIATARAVLNWIDTRAQVDQSDAESETQPITSGVRRLSTGGPHTCAIRSERADDDRDNVVCWGHNLLGQIKHRLGTFTDISVGGGFTCAIRAEAIIGSDGRPWKARTIDCWGSNSAGQTRPPRGSYTDVSAGGGHACAIRTDRSVACWGGNDPFSSFGQADAPEGTYTVVSAGGDHSCAIRAESGVGPLGRTWPAHSIACWGNNVSRQLIAPEGSFATVSSGGSYSCAIRTDLTISCWGNDQYNQLDAPEGEFIDVSAGLDHACAIRADATISCWGRNGHGEADAPEGAFAAVSAGSSLSCAVRMDETVVCWGLAGGWGFDHTSSDRTDVPAGLRVAK